MVGLRRMQIKQCITIIVTRKIHRHMSLKNPDDGNWCEVDVDIINILDTLIKKEAI